MGFLLSGARPTKGNSIEFEIRSNFAVLEFEICSTDRNEILHTSRQCNCRDVCKISLWSAEYVLNKSIANFGQISNSIEISLVGRAPGLGANPCYLLNVLPSNSLVSGFHSQLGQLAGMSRALWLVVLAVFGTVY